MLDMLDGDQAKYWKLIVYVPIQRMQVKVATLYCGFRSTLIGQGMGQGQSLRGSKQ